MAKEWDCLVRKRLYRLAFRLLWNHADTEDVLQDAAIVAQKRADDLRDPAAWWTWVCRIVVRQCHEIQRKKSRRLRLLRRVPIVRRHDDSPNESAPPEVDTELVDALESLPRRQREVLVLRHVQGMSFEELAAILEIKMETARVHAMRGREALRKAMRRKGIQREL